VHTRYLKQAGAKVIHAVFSVRHARRAEVEGVDVVVATGYEAGGVISQDEITTFVLVPQVVDAVKIPVVAAGGIADARGLVAALALGAEGIQMGTRFLATHECSAHPDLKQAILRAIDTDTIPTGRGSIVEARVLKNEFARQMLEMESAKMSAEELVTFIGSGRIRNALVEGDIKDGSALCGAIAGMITQIVSAGEVVRSLVDGYEAIVSRLK
jgi:enoyl-[acyl-carrier protein] reductase II